MVGPPQGPPDGGVPPNNPDAGSVRKVGTDNPAIKPKSPNKDTNLFDDLGRKEFLETSLSTLKSLLASPSSDKDSLLPPVGCSRPKVEQADTTGGATRPIDDHLSTLFPSPNKDEGADKSTRRSFRESINRLFTDLLGLAGGGSTTTDAPATQNNTTASVALFSSSTSDAPPAVPTTPITTPATEIVSNPVTPATAPVAKPSTTLFASTTTDTTPVPVVATNVTTVTSTTGEVLRPSATTQPLRPATEVVTTTQPVNSVPASNPNLALFTSTTVDTTSTPVVATTPVITPAAEVLRPTSTTQPLRPAPDVVVTTTSSPASVPASNPNLALFTSTTTDTTSTPVVVTAPIITPAAEVLRPTATTQPLRPATEVVATTTPVNSVPTSNPNLALFTSTTADTTSTPVVATAPITTPTAEVLRPAATTQPLHTATEIVTTANPTIPVRTNPNVALYNSTTTDATSPPIVATTAITGPSAEVLRPAAITQPLRQATEVATTTVPTPAVPTSNPNLALFTSPTSEKPPALNLTAAINPNTLEVVQVTQPLKPAPEIATTSSPSTPGSTPSLPVPATPSARVEVASVPQTQLPPIPSITNDAASPSHSIHQGAKSSIPALPEGTLVIGPSNNPASTTNSTPPLRADVPHTSVVSSSTPSPIVSLLAGLQRPSILQPPTDNSVVRSDLRDPVQPKGAQDQRPPDGPTLVTRSQPPNPLQPSVREGMVYSRDTNDDLHRKSVSPSTIPSNQPAVQDAAIVRNVPDQTNPSIRHIPGAERQPPSKEEFTLVAMHHSKFTPDTLSWKLPNDHGFKFVRELSPLAEQRLDIVGKPRWGAPIASMHADGETAITSLTSGSSLINPLDTGTGRKGPKEGAQQTINVDLRGIPLGNGKKNGADSADSEDASDGSPLSNKTGSSEPDPIPTPVPSGTTTSQSGVDPDPSDPSSSLTGGQQGQQIIGAMVLPNLEIIDPTQLATSPAEATNLTGLPQPTGVDTPLTSPRSEISDELSLQSAKEKAEKEIRVDSVSGELADKTETETKPKKRRNSKKESNGSDQQDQMEGLLAALLADLDGKRGDNRKIRKLLDDLFGDFEREEYTVKRGDTIESIATRKLKEKRLAPLLYAINRGILGNVPDYTKLKLKPGTKIQLPHSAEILRFRIHVLNDPTPLLIYTEARAGESIPSTAALSDRLTYTCRLGDTLLSIANRHPLLRNNSLWQLIAQLNHLSTDMDDDGKPIAKLRRGMTLNLPTVSEIEAFVSRVEHVGNGSEDHVHELPPHSVTSLHPKHQISVAHNRRRPRIRSSMSKSAISPNHLASLDSSAAAAATEQTAPITQSRIISQNDLGDGSSRLLLRLEVNWEGKWLPVIEYLVNEQASELNLYTATGEVRRNAINLPNRAARELAENDISANYHIYCEKFLSTDDGHGSQSYRGHKF